MKTASIILAAGQSKRMVSDTPKVVHKLNGKALIQYAIAAAKKAASETPVIVIGSGAELVRAEVGDQAVFAVQGERLGTAHAVLAAESAVAKDAELVLVTSAGHAPADRGNPDCHRGCPKRKQRTAHPADRAFQQSTRFRPHFTKRQW